MPRQCRLLRFSRETTISGPERDTYTLRPHAFRVRLQYQAPNMTPTISDSTLFVRDYNNDKNPRTFAKVSFFGQSLRGAHL